MTLAEFRRVGLKVSSFLSAFGLAKGAAFIGPLLLSQLMSIDDYGAAEFGLSVGAIAAQLVSLGITGAIPQLMLVRKEDRVLDILFFQVLVTGGLAMLAAVIVGLSGWGWHGAFACVAVGGAGAQLASSVYFRAKGWRYAIMLADNLSLYIFILVGGAILLAFGAPDSRSISIGYGSVVLATLLASAAGFTALVRPAFLKAYREAISIGFFMMVNGVIYVGLANSSRILVGTFMSLEDVSLYSICFRLSAAIMLVHSMMVTAFFKKMYEGEPEWFDWFYVRCLSVMMAVAVLLLVAFDLFGGVIIPAWRDKIPHLTAVLPITCIQAIWWVSMSQIALRLDRALITRQATGWLAVCVALMVITLAVLDVAGLLTLVTASSVFAAILLLAIQIQLYLLRRAGVHLRRTRLAIWAPLLLAPVTLAFLG
jgi:O-antigen/teichoic acid export membrane protein